MTKRRVKKLVKRADVRGRVRKALAKHTKAELIDALVERSRGLSRFSRRSQRKRDCPLPASADDRTVLRRLDARFELEAPPEELVAATRRVIADATAFDQRDINYNFDYDTAAYSETQRNLARLVKLGHLRPAMELSLELMDQGSRQVEMSDEGLMTDDIEMANRDRMGFIFDRELAALRHHFETPRSR
jgi:hypothetical protein